MNNLMNDQELTIEMLHRAIKEWEPEFIKPSNIFDDKKYGGWILCRSETEPVEVKGNWAEFVGFMAGEYQREKQKLLESAQEEYPNHSILGLEVRSHLEMDFMTNLFTGKVSLRLQAVLVPKS